MAPVIITNSLNSSIPVDAQDTRSLVMHQGNGHRWWGLGSRLFHRTLCSTSQIHTLVKSTVRNSESVMFTFGEFIFDFFTNHVI